MGHPGVGTGAASGGACNWPSAPAAAMNYIPYRGAAPAMIDLLAGQINLMVDQVQNSLVQVRAGSIKALAIASPNAQSRRCPRFRRSTRPARRGCICRCGTASGRRPARPRRSSPSCNAAVQRRAGRSGGARAADRTRHGNPAARAAEPGGAGRAAEGRHREMVADHQGGRHQESNREGGDEKSCSIAIALAALLGVAPASAQTYPSKPITMIVPFAAGGATDVLARFLGERMRAILGQTDHHRERHRRRRQHRGRPLGARAGRRLHDRDGHLDHQHAARRALSVAVRSHQRSGAGPADRQRAADDRRQEGPAGARTSRSWSPGSRPIPARPRSAFRRSAAPAISPGCRSSRRSAATAQFIPYRGNGPALAGPGGGPDRPADRAGVEFLCAGQGGRDQALRHHVERAAAWPRPTFRPPPRRACRDSRLRSGTGCGRRRTRRRTSSRKLNAAMLEALARSRRRASASPISASTRRRASSRRRRRCAHSRRRRRRSGGRSSRPPTSRQSGEGG